MPLAPAVAPVLGAYLAKFWGWPSIFLFVTLCAALAFLIIAIFVEETLPQSKRQPLKFRMALCNYKTILKNPRFVGCSLISGLMFSGTVGYVATSAFYYVRVLGLDAEIYGYTQMFHVFGFIGGAWANQRLIEKLSSRRLLELGLWSTLGGALLLCLVSVFLPQNVWFLTAGMTCYALGVGLTFSNTSNHALDVFPQFKGASSAMLGTIEMGCMAVFVWFTNLLYTGTFLPVTLSILGCSVINLALWEWIRVAFIANKREG